MSTTAYRTNHSSKSFPHSHLRRSSTTNNSSHVPILPSMTNDRTRYPIQTALTDSVSSQNSSSSSQLNDSSNSKLSKQTYTFSNPPRELQRQSLQNMKYLRHNRLRQRVSSAPDENSFLISPRSILNQQKPSSANDSLTPRSRDESPPPPSSMFIQSRFKRDEQEKHSLNALIKEQQRSKVPKAVQKRRIILLFRRLPGSTPPLISPRQHQNASPIKTDLPLIDLNRNSTKIVEETHLSTSPSSEPSTHDPFGCLDQAELADSKQIAAILANIQSLDEWIPVAATDGISPRREYKHFDPKKYEYVAKNSLDTATFKLSPRTLKPDEELAARSRFSQNYRYEMLSSANAQIPPLMASIVAENNNGMGSTMGSEKTFTFRLNPSTTMRKANSFDEIESIPSTLESEQVQLCFDEILKCFYDPNTGTYYELTSA